VVIHEGQPLEPDDADGTPPSGLDCVGADAASAFPGTAPNGMANCASFHAEALNDGAVDPLMA
jgi:hypothetical protein